MYFVYKNIFRQVLVYAIFLLVLNWVLTYGTRTDFYIMLSRKKCKVPVFVHHIITLLILAVFGKYKLLIFVEEFLIISWTVIITYYTWYYRLGWPGLVTHPFWQDKLCHLAKDLVLSQDVQGSTMTTVRSSVFVEGTGSVLGKIKTVDPGKSTDRPVSNLDLLDVTRPGRFFT